MFITVAFSSFSSMLTSWVYLKVHSLLWYFYFFVGNDLVLILVRFLASSRYGTSLCFSPVCSVSTYWIIPKTCSISIRYAIIHDTFLLRCACKIQWEFMYHITGKYVKHILFYFSQLPVGMSRNVWVIFQNQVWTKLLVFTSFKSYFNFSGKNYPTSLTYSRTNYLSKDAIKLSSKFKREM